MLALGTVAALAVALAGALPFALLAPMKHRVKDAADAAALAAASVAAGLTPGDPCEAAAAVAEANGVSMTGCRVEGQVVTVEARTSMLGVPMTSTSTAGPAGERAQP